MAVQVEQLGNGELGDTIWVSKWQLNLSQLSGQRTATRELWAIFKAGNLIVSHDFKDIVKFSNLLSDCNFGLEICSTNSSRSH